MLPNIDRRGPWRYGPSFGVGCPRIPRFKSYFERISSGRGASAAPTERSKRTFEREVRRVRLQPFEVRRRRTTPTIRSKCRDTLLRGAPCHYSDSDSDTDSDTVTHRDSLSLPCHYSDKYIDLVSLPHVTIVTTIVMDSDKKIVPNLYLIYVHACKLCVPLCYLLAVTSGPGFLFAIWVTT